MAQRGAALSGPEHAVSHYRYTQQRSASHLWRSRVCFLSWQDLCNMQDPLMTSPTCKPTPSSGEAIFDPEL